MPAKTKKVEAAHAVRVGIGGWTFEPWDETFYPKGLAKKRQLEHASRQLTAIEINGTFYRNQTPATFAKWAGETPDGFMFSVKAQRFCTMRKTREDMRASIQSFLESGVTELGDKLGPINWQFPATRKFTADYFTAFLGELPREHKKRALRHAIEVRHESFNTAEFHDLVRKHGCAIVAADDEDWPQADVETADFAYIRLQRTKAEEKTGYPAKDISAWAKTFKDWAKTRDVFAYFIAGAKERNPAAAMALISRLED
ncbi:MAG: DUF72 domain-containing protein [Hyphomonadaceae bacterium]